MVARYRPTGIFIFIYLFTLFILNFHLFFSFIVLGESIISLVRLSMTFSSYIFPALCGVVTWGQFHRHYCTKVLATSRKKVLIFIVRLFHKKFRTCRKYVLEGGGGGKGVELFTCPYRLKVQARPPRDQRLVTQCRVSRRNMYSYVRSFK